MVSPDSRATPCPPSGRNSTYRPVQISGASSERIGDINSAIELINEQIEIEGRRASLLIVEQISCRHKQLVADICTSLIAAHAAAKKYHALADALNQDEVSWTPLRPMHATKMLGEPWDRYSPVALYLKEALEYGLIDKSIIPPELRQ
jgi:hypothetical protein